MLIHISFGIGEGDSINSHFSKFSSLESCMSRTPIPNKITIVSMYVSHEH